MRDDVVLDYLGPPKTYPVDWPAFQDVSSDKHVVVSIDEAVEAATAPGVDMDPPGQRLRHLDVVLWMQAVGHRRQSEQER